MSDRLLAYFDDDNVAHVYRDAYKLTIQHETAEQLEETKRLLLRKGWIPVTERMPREHPLKNYSCTVSDPIIVSYDTGQVRVTISKNGKFRKDSIGSVIAWQPLPEPYREGEE